MKINKKITPYSIIVNVCLIGFALCCIFPIISIISISFSTDAELVKHGYRLWPRGFTDFAYKFALANPKQLINGYKVTLFVCTVGTTLSLLVTSGVAYMLSRSDYKYRNAVSLFIFIPMLFSAGLVPSYIWIVNYLHLKDNIMVLILPCLVSPIYVLMLRTFMQKIPVEIIESCMIDGASEYRIFFKMIIPLSISGLATVGVFTLMGFWNEWFLAMLYIDSSNKLPLQYMLVKIMSTIEYFKSAYSVKPVGMKDVVFPAESALMAVALLAAGPILLVFPFFQKYFVSGLTIGSVKG